MCRVCMQCQQQQEEGNRIHVPGVTEHWATMWVLETLLASSSNAD